MSSDSDQAFTVSSDYHKHLQNVLYPVDANQTTSKARKETCDIAERNKMLDGSWDLVADDEAEPEKRAAVGGVHFTVEIGRTNVSSLNIGGCDTEDGEAATQSQSGSFHVYADHDDPDEIIKA